MNDLDSLLDTIGVCPKAPNTALHVLILALTPQKIASKPLIDSKSYLVSAFFCLRKSLTLEAGNTWIPSFPLCDYSLITSFSYLKAPISLTEGTAQHTPLESSQAFLILVSGIFNLFLENSKGFLFIYLLEELQGGSSLIGPNLNGMT